MCGDLRLARKDLFSLSIMWVIERPAWQQVLVPFVTELSY